MCTSLGQYIFQYGGTDGANYQGSLYQLDIDSLEWSQLPSGPMRMIGSAMVAFGNNLVLFGGFGYSSGKANFKKSTKYNDGRGWSNAIHCFGLIEGETKQSLSGKLHHKLNHAVSCCPLPPVGYVTRA